MMSHTEASAYMGKIVDMATRNIRKDGYAFPIVIALSREENRRPPLSHELLITEATHVFKDLRLVDGEAFEPEPQRRVYVHMYLLRFDKVEDELRLGGILRSLARSARLDALGYICSCMYNMYDDVDDVDRGMVLRDPEAVRILYMSYYLNGDKRRRDLVVPFVNRGKRPCVSSLFGEEESTERYDILTADSGWFCPTPQDARKMKYPFGRGEKKQQHALDREEKHR
jgi:hypothetical protein